jgi:hypothetical protein
MTIFSEINSLLSIWDRFRKPAAKIKGNDTVASRFLQLFEAHGVHRNQIPRFFGHGLSLADVQDDSTILSRLSEELIEDACKLFAVRSEWLYGVDDQIYPLHDFYKVPGEFVDFIESLSADNDSFIEGVLLVAKIDKHDFDALIVLEVPIGSVGDKTICRYCLCNNWIFSYWKARAYLTACVASAWKRKISIIGRKVPIEIIKKYHNGIEFLQYENDGALPLIGTPWYPEDLALRPEIFLEGLGEGKSGKLLGLEMWLDLDDQGLMDTGINEAFPRQQFIQALDDLKK